MLCHFFPRKICTHCNEICGTNLYSSSRPLLCHLLDILEVIIQKYTVTKRQRAPDFLLYLFVS
jgi:hypothetical protein